MKISNAEYYDNITGFIRRIRSLQSLHDGINPRIQNGKYALNQRLMRSAGGKISQGQDTYLYQYPNLEKPFLISIKAQIGKQRSLP